MSSGSLNPPDPEKPGLWARFGVEPHETRSASLMLAHSAFMGFGTVFFETAAAALFLGQFGASALPTVYLAAAALSAVTGFLYSRLQNLVSFSRLMTGTILVLMLTVASIRGALVFTEAAALFFFAMVFYRVLSILTDLEYWAVAGRLYDLRQGKRLFGFIGTGEVMARIAGSFSVPLMLRLGSVSNLFLLSAVALLGSFVALRAVLPMIPRDEAPRPSTKSPAHRSSIGSLLQDPYLRFVMVVAFCGILGKYLVDFAFLQQVRTRFADAKDVASFFGLFSGISQCASLFIRVFLSGRILSSLGVHRGLLILPGAHVLCTGLLLLAGGLALGANPVFWLVVLNQGIYKSLKHPVDNPSLKTLYQPIPKERRLSLAIAVDALLNPLGIALSGGLMVLFTTVFDSNPVRFAWALMACFLFWLWSARAAGTEYVKALVGALRGRIEDIEFAFDDERAVGALRETLKTGSQDDALVAMQILGDHAPAALRPMLADLVIHPSFEVRRGALERVEAHRPPGIAVILRARLLAEPEDSLKALILRALSAVEGGASKEQMLRYARGPNRGLQEAAIVGLLRMGAAEGARRVEELARSHDAADRGAAARLLRLGGWKNLVPLVKTLIDDPDVAVQRLALFAAGSRRDLELLEPLILRINTRGVLGAARSSLALAGDMALPRLQREFDESRQTNVKRGLISTLSRIRSDASALFLLSKIDVEDVAVRQDVIRALTRLRFAVATHSERERVEGQAGREARHAIETLAQIRDLGEDESTLMLRSALAGSHRNTRERVLMLLGFTRDPGTLLAVRTHIDSAHKDQRAYAREILDVVLSREERALFMPAIEGELGDVAPELATELGLTQMAAEERLRRLFLDPSHVFEGWVRAAALDAAPRMKAAGLDVAIESFLETEAGAEFERTGAWSVGAIRGLIRGKGVGPMLLIEKVITLKAVDMFSRTPEDVLADVAALAEEVRVGAGDPIFAKGDPGESLYVIVRGEVKVHDGDVEIKRLGDKTVFGELAVLDPEPRSASVTAISDTHLLRLDREAFLELMAGNMEVVRGVLSVLCDRIRDKLDAARPSPAQAPASAKVPPSL